MNDLTITQISTIANAVVEQATGIKGLATTNTSEFVAVGQMALKTGYDNVMQAISQVMHKTIFSIRPYTRKFADFQVSNQRYGNHVRKLQPIDKPFKNDNRLPLTDGASVDQYKINKPEVLQTNFYGETVYSKDITIFRDQLDTAFLGPEQFGQFISMVMTNASDLIEQAHEELARGTLANLICGVVEAGGNEQVVHLLTEYNTATGKSYNAADLMEPDVFRAFTMWSYSRIQQISSMLTERSVLYHTNITDKAIARHTPKALQRLYLYAPYQMQAASMVLSDTYHDSMITLRPNEVVNFWQSITSPTAIMANATYLQADGTLDSADVAIDGVYGVLFDEEAAGYTVVNQWSAPSPFNADGGYTNMFWHFTDRYWNDFTENCVVFMLN